MNTTTLTWIVAGVLILGGGYWYVSHKGADTAGPSMQKQESADIETSDITSIFKKGGSYECTISMNTAQASSKGTVYISGTEVRGDFESAVGGQTVLSSMIQTGGYVYTWTNLYPQGFKFKSEVDANPFSTVGNAGMKMPEGGSYKCRPSTVDPAKFVPPTSVKFTVAPGVK